MTLNTGPVNQDHFHSPNSIQVSWTWVSMFSLFRLNQLFAEENDFKFVLHFIAVVNMHLTFLCDPFHRDRL